MATSEEKLALFTDDVLIYLSNPTESLPELITILPEYGSFSGSKLNEQKTQVLCFHYKPPHHLKQLYKLDWDKKSIKYLGIHLPMDMTESEELNYGPLKKEIIQDINRWNLTPFLSITSRVETIQMNILPRILYLFQSIPVEKPDPYFVEWDKIISRFVWAKSQE